MAHWLWPACRGHQERAQPPGVALPPGDHRDDPTLTAEANNALTLNNTVLDKAIRPRYAADQAAPSRAWPLGQAASVMVRISVPARTALVTGVLSAISASLARWTSSTPCRVISRSIHLVSRSATM
jgi:hypothetical protein